MKRNMEIFNDLVSVIVPIYNADKYLEACIKSIISQTYQNLELILVNDGSLDSSLSICEKYSQNYSNIVIINQENQGVSAARKNGVLSAKGEWIIFVDADDVLLDAAIDTLLKNKSNCDIIIGQVDFSGPYKWPYPIMSHHFSSSDYVSILIKKNIIHSGPVARIIKRKLFTNREIFNIPREVTNGEDFIMNLRLGLAASHIRIIPNIVYKYINRESSVSQNPVISKMRYNILFSKCVKESFNKDDLIIHDKLIKFYLLSRIKKCLKLKMKNLINVCLRRN
jgi:glycosyltransferase involved in cell wall biosynthesis